MEEILSSIKRIIAEEGDVAPRVRRAGRAAPPPEPEGDEILELSDPMPIERAAAGRATPERPAPERPSSGRDRAQPQDPYRVEMPAPAQPADSGWPDDHAAVPERAPSRSAPGASPPAVSRGTVEATRGALDNLSRLLVRPEPGSDGTLEGLIREMIRPMLSDWLDANLPALVEEMVAREIGRITGSQR